MKSLKKPVSILLSLLMLLSVFSLGTITAGAESEFAYEVIDDTYIQITGYKGSAENVVIPEEIDGKEVYSIADFAFLSNSSIKSISMPYCLVNIGNYAFSSCTALESVTTYAGVFGECAFDGCSDLSSVTLRASVNHFYDDAFCNCKKLSSITIPNSPLAVYGKHCLGYYSSGGYQKVDGFTIRSYDNTPAETYAEENGFKFELAYTPIDSVEFTVAAPAYGQTPETMFESPENYEIQGAMWYDENGVSVSEFNSAEQYTVVFEISARSGFGFKNDVSAKINGETATIAPSMDSYAMGGATVSYTFPKMTVPVLRTPIDEVSLSVTAPEFGKAWNPLPTITGECVCDNINVYLSDEFYDTDTPLVEGTYKVEYLLKAYDGYAFKGDSANITTSVTVNALPASLTSYLDEDVADYIVASFEFNVIKAEESDFVVENLEDGTVKIKEYKGTAKELVIPSQIGGKTVTIIDNLAFFENNTLTKVTIPGTVTNLDSAFYYCTKLKTAIVSEGVPEISAHAFESCENLTIVSIPSTVKAIGTQAFNHSESLVEAELPEGLTSIGSSAFNRTAITKVELPSTLTSIGTGAFVESKVRTVTIPSSVTSLSDAVFSGCEQLESATINCEIKNLPARTFFACHNLSSVKLPAGITVIESEAFSGCESLSGIEIPASVTKMEYYAFKGCTSLSGINLPDGLETIKYDCFVDCGNLKNLTIPASVTSIDDNAFGYRYDDVSEEYKLYEGVTITGYKDTEAEKYANLNGINFIALETPAEPTETPTEAPTEKPTEAPTEKPTEKPTEAPTETPTEAPTQAPTETPTEAPTQAPTEAPTEAPTQAPTEKPTETPTQAPTQAPTDEPTAPPKTDISKWKVSGIKNKTYTGKAITQKLEVVSPEGEYADFKVSYKNNTNAGTATVTITGIGDFTGTIKKTFKIAKANNPMTAKAVAKTVKLSAVKKKAVAVKGTVAVKKNQGALTYAKVAKGSSKLLTISKSGVITVKKGTKKGTYKISVKVTAKGGANYKSASKVITVKISVK